MKTVEHENTLYPHLQTTGNAARFAIPFAKEILSGTGLDIGCNRPEWAFPGAILIDPLISGPWDAYHLPDEQYDYIFSSHCLEHLEDWVEALDYWKTRLKPGGVIFLYLPHYAQTYWRPWNNRKHVNIITSQFLRDYFESRQYTNIFVTEGYDLNHSFYGIAENV